MKVVLHLTNPKLNIYHIQVNRQRNLFILFNEFFFQNRAHLKLFGIHYKKASGISAKQALHQHL